MWNIVFYNDDHTPMDFVVFVLTKVFHRSTEDALALTLAVHTQGKGIAGTYTFEVAEQKQCASWPGKSFKPSNSVSTAKRSSISSAMALTPPPRWSAPRGSATGR